MMGSQSLIAASATRQAPPKITPLQKEVHPQRGCSVKSHRHTRGVSSFRKAGFDLSLLLL